MSPPLRSPGEGVRQLPRSPSPLRLGRFRLPKMLSLQDAKDILDSLVLPMEAGGDNGVPLSLSPLPVPNFPAQTAPSAGTGLVIPPDEGSGCSRVPRVAPVFNGGKSALSTSTDFDGSETTWGGRELQ